MRTSGSATHPNVREVLPLASSVRRVRRALSFAPTSLAKSSRVPII